MAKANPANLQPQPVEPPKDGPVIELVGEGAKDVKFTINPRAVRYTVYGPTGIVLEYLA